MKDNKTKNIEHADELKRIIDGVSELIKESYNRGYTPTFKVCCGRIGLVACFPNEMLEHADKPKRGRGRPRKTDATNGGIVDQQICEEAE